MTIFRSGNYAKIGVGEPAAKGRPLFTVPCTSGVMIPARNALEQANRVGDLALSRSPPFVRYALCTKGELLCLLQRTTRYL